MSGNQPQILQALVEADEPEAIPLLMDCLASRHQGTVRFAALSIGKMASNKQDICNIAVPQLVDALSSDDPLTRRTVLNALLLLNIPLNFSKIKIPFCSSVSGSASIIQFLIPSNSRGLKNRAVLNSFVLTPRQWIDTTNVKSLASQSGSCGCTTGAHIIGGD